ncbi:MAG: glycosyl hydrolase 53 family protein [Treponema sp.]|nr:glycosyl hydrolase 53 family protein [Treponema sp.]
MKKILLTAAVSILTASFCFCGTSLNGIAQPDPAGEAVKRSITVEPVPNLPKDFMCGVDISSLSDIEKAGGKYYNHNGKEQDLFKILKKNGVNWVRIRVWNNPVYAEDLTNPLGNIIALKGEAYGGGNNSVDVDIKLARRAKKAGLKVLLDFHYSDSWADPAKQYMPQDWKNLSEDELNKAVEDFTYDTIKKFIRGRARPDMVQIGNELNNGFMWPLGKIWADKGEKAGGMKGFTRLLKSAASGVDRAQNWWDRLWHKKISVMIHLADGGDNHLYRTIFDGIEKNNVPYDVIGLSFYTYWHGSPEDLTKNMKDLSERYKKDLVVAETAYAFTQDDGDGQGNVFKSFSSASRGYLASVQGQASAVRDVIAAAASVPRGKGVFYWEPAWIPVEGAGLSATEGDTWENQGMFDYEGRALPSLAVWNLVRGKGEVKNAWGGSANLSAKFEPYSMEEKINVTTRPGASPDLPHTVKVFYTNDSASMVSVDWEDHDWKKERDGAEIILHGKIEGSSFTPEATVTVSSKINLIADPSFESGEMGKWILDGPGEACFMENNKGNAYTGKWTYKYWLDKGFKSDLHQSFDNLESGTYLLSVWAMGGGGENSIELYAGDFAGSGSEAKTQIVNTGWVQWKKYDLEVPVKSGTARVGIRLDTKAGNWGNFDDMTFVKID